MSNSETQLFQMHQRSNWVRLRTLVILRWIAIAGQIAAIIIAVSIYKLQLPVGFAMLIILCSVFVNLFSAFSYPENKRLSEREARWILVYDIIQLSLLLYLTGGLNNPFALLILAPVTIASTVLGKRSMIMIGAVAIGLISLIGITNVSIITSSGAILSMPTLFQFGFWVSLVTGIIFVAYYARLVTTEMNAMGDALVATQLALAREQKLTDLGGVVAAAAHELGTPLATIKLASSELIEELEESPELREDADLIRQQAERCREILHSMGRAGKDDLHLRSAPLEAVVQEAAEPHLDRGKDVFIDASGSDDLSLNQPQIARRPEVIHGLRNLVQNAVDFAGGMVEVEASWTEEDVLVTITDDGPGFPPSVMGRIGDPFVRRRRRSVDTEKRPEYEGMGLGLFIAKTLLERSGAQLSFSNISKENGEAGGAQVVVTWPRSRLESLDSGQDAALGENQPFLP